MQRKALNISFITVLFLLCLFSSPNVMANRQAKITRCGNLTVGNTTYVLENDVSSPGTCFAVEASRITLNLNGHTITYGTAAGTSPAPAFALCDGWYRQLTSSQCGGDGHADFTVYGGTVTQAADAPPFSPIFWVGQGNGMGHGTIHNITAIFSSTGSQFFHGDYPGAGWKIQNNTIHDNVANIQHPDQGALSARSQLQGYVIKIDNGGGAKGTPDDISGNTINGSPQGGISDGQPGSEIYNNTIHLTSTYSNDYGVLSMSDNQNIHDNIVTGQGRGLDAEGNEFILNHNTVAVQESNKNTEYNGCELGGTYGIRVKNYGPSLVSTKFAITNNNITVTANPCPAQALVFTNMVPAVTGIISFNKFKTVAGPVSDYVLALNSVNNLTGIEYSQNNFTGTTCVLIDNSGDIGSGANTVIQAGQIWNCGIDGPTVAATDLTTPGTAKNSYPEYLKIMDAIPKPAVSCGSYSTAFVQIGSYRKQCGPRPNKSSAAKH